MFHREQKIQSIRQRQPLVILSQGVPGAINQTGKFLGNVSETIAENPVVTNITGETQKFFGEASK